jgi:predicted flap endonuclease-1-like 5' DNA nuclease
MPTRSRDEPTGTVQELGLPPRAVGALTRAGITTVEELAALTRRELAAVPGLGPAMVTAIRAVVPEPVAQGLWPQREDDGAPAAPVIPSFDSLRAPRRRTAFDVLVPGDADAVDDTTADTVADAVADAVDRQDVPAPRPTPPAAPPAAAPAGAPRPAEWADLAALGARGVRVAAVLPWRVALWWVQAPVRLADRLLGRR